MGTTYTAKSAGAGRWEVDASVEFAAAHYQMDSPTTAVYRAVTDRNDSVSLSGGYVSSGTPKTIQVLTNGVVDEYQLRFTPTEVEQNVIGRDEAAYLLDRYANRLYRRAPQATALSTLPAGTNLPPPPLTLVGQFTARQIANDLVTLVAGLTLSWEVRDYILLEDFNAVGRVSDLLQRLIAPWQQVEPYRADLSVQGGVVLVRYRTTPGTTLAPQYVFTMTEAQQANLTVRKRPGRKYGLVILRGSKLAGSLSDSSNSGALALPPDQGLAGAIKGSQHTVTFENVTYDILGNFVSRVTNDVTYQMPDRVVLKQVKSTYTAVSPEVSIPAQTQTLDDAGRPVTVTGVATVLGAPEPQLTTIETIDSTYEAFLYGETGRINNPKHLADLVTRQQYDPTDNNFKTLSDDQILYAYDTDGFQSGKTTIKRQFNPTDGTLDVATAEVEYLLDIEPLIAAQVRQNFSLDASDPTAPRWAFISSEQTLAGGHRPGGPGRTPPKTAQGASLLQGNLAGLGLEEAVVWKKISSDVDAVPISYTNKSMQVGDLNFLLSLFVAASGLWEYEFQFSGPAMVWLRPGMVIQFTGLTVEDGVTTLTLPPAIVTEIRTRYDESRPDASLTAQVRAFAWSAT